MPDLTLIDQGQVVTSFSGVDYNVVGYVPVEIPVNAEFGGRYGRVNDDPKLRLPGIQQPPTVPRNPFFHRMASLQTVSISSVRDSVAVRRLGSAWAFDFSRGCRSVAGSLVFAMLDGDAFKEFAHSMAQWKGMSREDQGRYLPDALPPFNIIIQATNESGGVVIGMLMGVTIVNSALTFGIHDVYTETPYSWQATRYIPLNSLRSPDEFLQGTLKDPDFEAKIKEVYGRYELKWRKPSLHIVDGATLGLHKKTTHERVLDAVQPIERE